MKDTQKLQLKEMNDELGRLTKDFQAMSDREQRKVKLQEILVVYEKKANIKKPNVIERQVVKTLKKLYVKLGNEKELKRYMKSIERKGLKNIKNMKNEK